MKAFLSRNLLVVSVVAMAGAIVFGQVAMAAIYNPPVAATTFSGAAADLTGTTLAGNVVSSSLTSVGTLSTLTVSGNTSFGNASTTAALFGGTFSANSLNVGGTATTTITTGGKIGIATSTPTYDLTLAAGKSVGAVENILTGTSTTYTISAANGPVQLYRTGTAATTFTATGFLPGVKVDFEVCNPGASAGALTWSGFHTFGTAPTQTTTANQCDKYVVGMTAATSSPTGIMYYAQAGAGLQ